MNARVRVIPLTEEEMEQIQITVADKMLELNQRSDSAESQEDVCRQLEKLRKVVEKIHNYHSSCIPSTR